jgi:4a-hydroxytetrahydrobiopterin dehydratase
MKPAPLNEDELLGLAAHLPGWKVSAQALEKTYLFESYLDGIEFVRRLAVAAEAMDHHPDLRVGWRKVTVTSTTHSVGAVTRLDEALALKAEASLRQP